MSSIQKKMVFFGQWSPDGVEFDNPDLEISENVVPVYGAHRPLNKLRELSNQADAAPITAAYAHLVSSALPQQRITPLGAPVTYTDTDETGWYNQAGVDIHTLDDEGASSIAGFAPDDESFVFTNDNDGTNESNYKVWLLNTPRITPASFSNPVYLTVRAKYKNPNGVTTPKVEMWLSDDTDDLVGTEAAPVSVTITKDAGDDDFEELSHTLTTGGGSETALLLAADWSTLELAIRADIPDTDSDTVYQDPDADLLTTGWVIDETDPVSATNFYENMAREYTDDTLYLDSWVYASIPKGASRTIVVEHASLASTWANVDSLVPGFAIGSDKANTSFKVELLQVDASGADDPDADGFVLYGEVPYRIVKTWNENNVSIVAATPTQIDTAVLPADLNEPDFNEKFYLAFTPTYAGDGSGGGSQVTVYPTGPDPIATGGLTGDGSDLDTDDDNGIKWNNADFRQFRVDFSVTEAADRRGGRSLTIKGTPGMAFAAVLNGYNTAVGERRTIEQWTSPGQTIPSSGTFSVNFTGAYNEHTDVQLLIQATATGVAQGFTYVAYTYEGDSAKANIYSAAFGQEQPIGRGLAISHAYLDAESDVNLNQVDRVELYAGTKTKLYLLDSESWVDVTRTATAGDYGDDADLSDTARVWDFTSWGDDIIAVNYADEPQRLVAGTSLFVDLVSSGIVPRARFCAVIGAQLILADINPVAGASGDAYTDGKPYSLWASGILDPTTFKAADYDTQSAIFSLIAQPGAITGLVGGEYGIVFKRNSIWRMSYVGLPVVFKFDTISIGQGTPFPQSIVPVDSDVYFWGNGGIFRVNRGQELQRLSGGRIEKVIFDTRFESYALQVDYTSNTVLNESLVQGAYDAYSGLVWWFYKGPGDTDHHLTHFITYNPREDRFSHGQIDSLNVAAAASRSNVSFSELGIHRGLEVLTYNTAEDTAGHSKFQGATTEPATMVSKIISPRTLNYEDGREIEIQAVRPIFRSQPESTNPPNFSVKVESAQDPNMYRGLATQTVDHRRVDDDGWMYLPRLTQGEFHRLTVKFPSVSDIQIKEFLGVQLQIRAAGDF